jgi:mRNA interferase YafQ
MRTISWTTAFKKDYKREKRGVWRVDALLEGVVESLRWDIPLLPAKRDHPLSGEWIGHRECHLAPDLLLIYRKSPGLLELTRLGSHSELFG